MNKAVGNVKAAEVDSIVACACSPTSDNACAQDSDCLNRMLLVECSPEICPAGVKCQNQCFVQRIYPIMEPFHTIGRGWGLRALELIKANQFVVEYVGEIIDEAEYKRRLQRKKELKNENYYFLTIDTNRMIDAEPKGNLSRFMSEFSFFFSLITQFLLSISVSCDFQFFLLVIRSCCILLFYFPFLSLKKILFLVFFLF